MNAEVRPVLRHLVRTGASGYLLWTLTPAEAGGYICRRWKLSRAERRAYEVWSVLCARQDRKSFAHTLPPPELSSFQADHHICRTLHEAFHYFSEGERYRAAAELFFNTTHRRPANDDGLPFG